MVRCNDRPAPQDDSFDFGPVISSYTRRQAIEDGVLVQISGPGYEGDDWMPKMAAELGYKTPLAMTLEAFTLCVDLSPAAVKACNDIEGRLWDVLYMLICKIRRTREEGSVILFDLHCVTTRVRPSLVRLKAVCGPDDDGEPCITIMLPNQD